MVVVKENDFTFIKNYNNLKPNPSIFRERSAKQIAGTYNIYLYYTSIKNLIVLEIKFLIPTERFDGLDYIT